MQEVSTHYVELPYYLDIHAYCIPIVKEVGPAVLLKFDNIRGVFMALSNICNGGNKVPSLFDMVLNSTPTPHPPTPSLSPP